MLIFFMVLAAFLTWFVSRRKNVLLGVAASLLWFACAMWLFFSIDPDTGKSILPLTENYAKLLAGTLFLLTFLPLTLQMDTEITRKVGDTQWKTFGDTPAGKIETKADAYKTLFRKKYRR